MRIIRSGRRTAGAPPHGRVGACAASGLLLVVMALSCAGRADAQSTKSGRRHGAPAPAAAPPQDNAQSITPLSCAQREVPDFIWGLTATNVNNVPDITSALTDLGTAFPGLKPDELPPIMVRVVFDTEAYVLTTPGGSSTEPLKLRAVDLTTGKEVWSRPVRDTTYRGPSPP